VSLKVSVLFALALTTGCNLLKASGPSDVARGEYYSAGQPEFDEFFIVLHDKQVELLAAPSEPADARKNLTQVAGLTPDASDDSLKERLSQEMKKLAGQGLRFRLEVPEPSPALDASATLHASETSTSTPYRSALPEQATRLVRSRNHMLAAKAELQKLSVSSVELEGKIYPSFRTGGPWKRDEVHQNLVDGQKVITLMQARAQDVADQDTRLLALVASAATTDANLGKAPAYAPPTPPSEEPAKPAGKRAPAGKPAAKPSTAAPTAKPPAVAPAPKPVAKRGGDDDGAAAPKPTQGSAPAEIEP
jgi:hypothetical protein